MTFAGSLLLVAGLALASLLAGRIVVGGFGADLLRRFDAAAAAGSLVLGAAVLTLLSIGLSAAGFPTPPLVALVPAVLLVPLALAWKRRRLDVLRPRGPARAWLALVVPATATAVVALLPVLRTNGFAIGNDTYTYCAFSEWLQHHGFSEPCPLDPYSPVTGIPWLWAAAPLRPRDRPSAGARPGGRESAGLAARLPGDRGLRDGGGHRRPVPGRPTGPALRLGVGRGRGARFRGRAARPLLGAPQRLPPADVRARRVAARRGASRPFPPAAAILPRQRRARRDPIRVPAGRVRAAPPRSRPRRRSRSSRASAGRAVAGRCAASPCGRVAWPRSSSSSACGTSSGWSCACVGS